MKIIQNFSSSKHIAQLPFFDIALWYVELQQLKNFGYTLKLYCEEKDFVFLRQWHLLELYDEVDSSFLTSLSKNKKYISINDKYFWSKRKLFCIDYEFQVNPEPFMYMDTDILLFRPFLPAKAFDLVVWGVESRSTYFAWDYFSLPPNYKLDRAMEDTNIAFNCGILKFKDYEIFQQYFQEYQNFTINNPCQILHPFLAKDTNPSQDFIDYTIRNIWATNAEQRILAGVSNRHHWLVKTFMGNSPVGKTGYSYDGIHYFGLKAFLRAIYWWTKDGQALDDDMIDILEEYEEQFRMLLDTINQHNPEVLEVFLENQEVREFYINHKKLNNYI